MDMLTDPADTTTIDPFPPERNEYFFIKPGQPGLHSGAAGFVFLCGIRSRAEIRPAACEAEGIYFSIPVPEAYGFLRWEG
jgi:hypothetical protein